MIRVQVVLTFLICVVVVAITGYASHQSMLSEALEQDAEESLRRAATIAEQERLIEESSMIAKARFVAGGEDLYEAIKADYSDAAASPEEGEEGAEEGEGAGGAGELTEEQRQQISHAQHLKVHERLLRYEKEFELYAKGPGKDKDQMDLPLRWRRPIKPDLFFAVDAEGRGLAALGKDLFKWYGDDISQDYQLLSEVLVKKDVRTALWRFSFDPSVKEENRPLYLVALAPIRPNRGADPAGVVVIGSLVNDGAAERAQDLIAGIAGQDLEEAEQKRVMASAPALAFYHKGNIVGSTFDSADQKELFTKLIKEGKLLEQDATEKVGEVQIGEDDYIARARTLPGRSDAKVQSGILVLSNVTHATEPLEEPGMYTILVAVMVALLGAVVLLVLIQLYMKPLADIESGVQEIVSGDKDYEFSYRGSNKIAQGLAHQLNLMSAYLQGKPMPDDDNAGGAWDDMNGGGSQKPSQVQGVSMDDLMGGGKKSDDDDKG